MNSLNVWGLVTQDLKEFGKAGGVTAASFFMIVPDYRNRKDNALFMKIVCFGKLADHLMAVGLRKDDAVTVSGRMEPDHYVKKDGTKMFGIQVVAEAVHLEKRGDEPREKLERQEPREDPTRRVDEPEDFPF